MEAAGVRLGEGPHQPAGIRDVLPAGQRQFGAAEGLVELQVLQRFGPGWLVLDASQQRRRLVPFAVEHLALGVSQVQRLVLEVDVLDLVDRDFRGARPAAPIETDARRVHVRRRGPTAWRRKSISPDRPPRPPRQAPGTATRTRAPGTEYGEVGWVERSEPHPASDVG